jgi:DnaJ-class molecular chaperone
MTDIKDPYQILGVSRNATQGEIKRAYRRLAKQSHPDRNPNDKSAERFKEVHAAYEVLGDPQRRAQYDRFGAGGPAPDVRAWTTGPGVPFEDLSFDFGSLGDLTSIFEQFFSRAGGRNRHSSARRPAPRGEDLEHAIELSFEEAIHGTVREVVLTTDGPGRPQERIRFRVPARVTDGQRIRVPGKGHEGPGGRGDLMIHCRVLPHPYFRQEGNDILLDLPLTLAEAALGTSVEIPTLAGPAVVKVPPGTSGGTRLRLRGRGVRDDRTGQTGDMYAMVRIQVPRNLSVRAQELLRELDQELKQRPREDLGWAQ